MAPDRIKELLGHTEFVISLVPLAVCTVVTLVYL